MLQLSGIKYFIFNGINVSGIGWLQAVAVLTLNTPAPASLVALPLLSLVMVKKNLAAFVCVCVCVWEAVNLVFKGSYLETT